MALSAKDPLEIITVTFDFTALAASLSGAVVSVVSVGGINDLNPSAMLSGVASTVGAKVSQQLIGGNSGSIYELKCLVNTPDGSRYVLSDKLNVVNI